MGGKEKSLKERRGIASSPFSWSPMAAVQGSVLQSFPFRVAVFALCVLLLPPLLPSPPGGEGGGQEFLAKAWELLHLLFVGIAVSYGLFSRKNGGGGGRVAEKDVAAPAAKADARYVSRMLEDHSLVFDDDGDGLAPDNPHGAEVRSWSALHHPEDPVVMVAAGGGGGRSQAADAQQVPLSLPVRTLRPQPAQDSNAGHSNGESLARPRGGAHDTVLPSPIPWRSRSGRLDASGRASSSPSPSPSPKRLSPASSLSKETLAKDSEEYAAKRRSPYRSSLSSPPPAPPPPPPPFHVHGYHPVAERRTAAKSFKEELQDHSIRGRGDHYSLSSHIFSDSTYKNSSPANPRTSFDGSSSSVARSVRTIRPREGVQIQSQSQELPDDAGDELGLHGSEESYGHTAYESISRFQYERGSSDPILGTVTVSSDETESSDDDDDVGEYSTRANSPRESTPEVDENEVDKKAEEFIAKFREHMRLQRIEDIKKSAGPRGVKHGK